MDSRLWTPDKTCLPFHLEAQDSYAEAHKVWSFIVPNDCLAVITDLATAQNPGIHPIKHTVRLCCTEGESAPLAVGGMQPCMPTGGNLANVEELTIGINEFIIRNSPGWVTDLPTRFESRPIGFILKPGRVTIFQNGASFGLNNAFYIHGYIFPLRPH